MTDIIESLSEKDQPNATFRALEALANDVIGVRLFTLLLIDHTRSVVWRIYSNMPQDYPIGGEKPLLDNAWSHSLINRRQPFVANTIEDIELVFSDHALIQSLGCESCINVPIVIAGQVVGTLNCLHVAGHYTPARVDDAARLAGPGAVAVLMADRFAPSGTK